MSESDENVRDKSVHEGELTSSSSTSGEEDPPQRRKRKLSRREVGCQKKSKVLEHLAEQVSQIQNYLASNAYPPSGWYPADPGYHHPLETHVENLVPTKQDAHLVEVPAESAIKFDFNLKTSLKEPTVLSAITHGIIMQSDALKSGVFDLLQWVQDTDNFVKDDLVKKIKDIFSGEFQKISLDCLQLLCGRRADIIEQRREAFLNLVKDKFLKTTLKKIPPSCDFLFSKEQFSDFLNNNGGINKIFSRPSFSAQEKRSTGTSQAAQPGSSSYNRTGRPTAPFALQCRAPQYPYRSYAPMQPYAFNYNFPAYAGNQRLSRPQYKPQSFTAGPQAPSNPRKSFNQHGASSQHISVKRRGRGEQVKVGRANPGCSQNSKRVRMDRQHIQVNPSPPEVVGVPRSSMGYLEQQEKPATEENSGSTDHYSKISHTTTSDASGSSRSSRDHEFCPSGCPTGSIKLPLSPETLHIYASKQCQGENSATNTGNERTQVVEAELRQVVSTSPSTS
ncbi:unnamed protein product, partial [Brenthis ino]